LTFWPTPATLHTRFVGKIVLYSQKVRKAKKVENRRKQMGARGWRHPATC